MYMFVDILIFIFLNVCRSLIIEQRYILGARVDGTIKPKLNRLARNVRRNVIDILTISYHIRAVCSGF